MVIQNRLPVFCDVVNRVQLMNSLRYIGEIVIDLLPHGRVVVLGDLKLFFLVL